MSVKAFVLGILGAALVLAIAWLGYLAYDTRQKAVRGDAAATFIEQQIKSQQAQTAPK